MLQGRHRQAAILDALDEARDAPRVFWAAVCLALLLVASKAFYLGLPGAFAPGALAAYLLSLAAISYGDVLFATWVWASTRALLALAGSSARAGAVRWLVPLFAVAVAAASAVYAAASVVFFGIFGGFLTYPLLALVGDVRMLSSSVAAHVTPAVAVALAAIPVAYALAVEAVVRITPRQRRASGLRGAIATLPLALWLGAGVYGFSADWTSRQDRRIAENPHWVLLSSWWQVVTGDAAVRMAEQFPAGDLADFAPPPPRTALPVPRPMNVIIVVLESVAARWTSLHGGPYDSTPVLETESRHALVADNFYAHIGRSSNSLAAMLLSRYPKLGFRDLTEEYPALPGTSLAAVFRDAGYRTAFVTPSDLAWAGWSTFLQARGFDELSDLHQLACGAPVSSWGVEDRCMVDGILDFIDREPGAPFFVLSWTTQTHHPYEPTPGLPVLAIRREPVPAQWQWDFDRYVSVLRETDRQLGRIFEVLRQRRLDRQTIVVVVGDHGQAFGYPHDTYLQGRTMYEEDVRVPLMIWSPRLFSSPARSRTIGGHVDLAPTIAGLAGLGPASEWQGRSLLQPGRSGRVYFYVAEDSFTLGLREGPWKYIFDLRDGTDELYNLERDPDEQRNQAGLEPARSARMRQRLAAWTESNRRQYSDVDPAIR